MTAGCVLGWGALLILGLGAGVEAATAPDPAALRAAVRAYRRSHEGDILREFASLLSLPNVASDRGSLRRNAERIVAMLEQRGVRARLLEAPGSPPAVLGDLPAPGARKTVVVYAHYDGQPVDPTQWTGDPFVPALRDAPLDAGGGEVSLDGFRGPAGPEWRLYARGASDDKAPIMGIVSALDALRAAGIPRTVGLKLFFEGEEESGSPHLRDLLRANRDALEGDVWLLCDGPVHPTRRLQVFFGARGITDVEMTLYGPLRALHSGHYGNWAPNPLAQLVELLASMRDPDGAIRIDGFSDDVRPLTPFERAAVDRLPDVDGELRASLGLAETEARNARLAERILLPALNLRGLSGGGVGALAANAIPTEARASLDFRLVPDQTPEGVRARVEAHLRSRGAYVVHEAPDAATRRAHPRIVRLEWGTGYPPARTPMDALVSRAVVRVVSESAGEPALAIPTLGGSIPMYLFQEILDRPVIGVPIANHDNNQHAANENLRIQNLWDGIDLYAFLLVRLGPALAEAR